MPLFSSESRLADAIFCDSSLIPVIDRFGIYLGVGDISIGEVCRRHDISSDFFLAVVNTFLNEDYFPDDSENAFPIDALLEFLSKTNAYYSKAQLQNIERHFRLLIERSGHNGNNLDHIFRFFLELKEDLINCERADDKIWFPMIREKNEDTIYATGEYDLENDEIPMLPNGLEKAFEDRNQVEEKIADLASIFVIHLSGSYDKTLCLAVVNAIFMLKKDIAQNNRIRNRILLPAVCRLFL